jgi:hypothetical protein
MAISISESEGEAAIRDKEPAYLFGSGVVIKFTVMVLSINNGSIITVLLQVTGNGGSSQQQKCACPGVDYCRAKSAVYRYCIIILIFCVQAMRRI